MCECDFGSGRYIFSEDDAREACEACVEEWLQLDQSHTDPFAQPYQAIPHDIY